MGVLQAMKDALNILSDYQGKTTRVEWAKAEHNLRAAIAAYEQQIEEMEKAEPAVELQAFNAGLEAAALKCMQYPCESGSYIEKEIRGLELR